MRYSRWAALVGALCLSAAAWPALVRSPDTMTVNPTRPGTFLVRWFDDAGQRFTTGPGLFCTQFNFLAGCVPATVLGRIPAARDRGINTTPVNAFTDNVTVPASVANRALKLLEADPTRGQFFFVRAFTPEGAANLGGGAGVTVFAQVNVLLSGSTASAPLSLTRVELYGREPGRARVRLIRLVDDNLATGEVVACIDYAGLGRLSGYWEVAGPNDPRLRELDRFPEAALSQEQRLRQRRFQRVERFIRQLSPAGRECLMLPYAKLPRDVPGVYQVFLRIEKSRNPLAQSSLNFPAGSPNLESGAVASFAMPALQYRVGAMLGKVGERDLAARLVAGRDAAGVRRVAVHWTPIRSSPLVVRLSVKRRDRDQAHHLIAPIAQGRADLTAMVPAADALDDYEFIIEALDPDGSVHAPTQAVRLRDSSSL